MTVEECYAQLGGNYHQVLSRLPSQRLIEKFIVKFLDDTSYTVLCEEMMRGNRAEAFRAAHTLKGVCANLSFDRLLTSASSLTELLRPESDTIPPEAQTLLDQVQQDYQLTVNAIRAFLKEKES